MASCNEVSRAIGDVYKLYLENIAPGGDALGRFEGKPVFVEGGAPDETILCRTTHERKTWAKAELLEIIEPSPVRTEKICAFYGKCGGCNLQHINYEAQLKAKVFILKDSFIKIGGIQPPEPEVFPSPPLEYRNRMQFHCIRDKVVSSAARAGSRTSMEAKFGFMGRRSTEIIPVSDCPIAEKGIRDLLQHGVDIPLPPEKDRFTVFSKDGLFLSEGGTRRGKIKLLDREIILDTGVFFQSNCLMLEKLIIELKEIACTTETNLPMADLYCGVGTFALFLRDLFPKVILAEENKTAVSIARENLKDTAYEFFALRDTQWEGAFLRKKHAFGFAVIDPPRAGLSAKLAEALAQNGPPVLAYVSCDAASLARDSKILVNGGYSLAILKIFDFYPHTAHIETLAIFER